MDGPLPATNLGKAPMTLDGDFRDGDFVKVATGFLRGRPSTEHPEVLIIWGIVANIWIWLIINQAFVAILLNESLFQLKSPMPAKRISRQLKIVLYRVRIVACKLACSFQRHEKARDGILTMSPKFHQFKQKDLKFWATIVLVEI